MALNYGEVVAEYAADDRSNDARVDEHGDWLDTAALSRLAGDTSVALVPKMAKLLISELRRHASIIDAAAKTEDVPLLARASHVMKSSAATFGLGRVQTAAERLNAACKAEDPGPVQVLAAHLLTQIDPSVRALEQTCEIDKDVEA